MAQYAFVTDGEVTVDLLGALRVLLLLVALGGGVSDAGGDQQRQRSSGDVPEGLLAVAQGDCGVF